MSEALRKLREPLTAVEIEWRVQSTTKDKSKTQIAPYIDNRAVMERFDAAFGADGWQNQLQPLGDSFLCGLGVKFGAEWIWKWDGADKSDIEGTKGGISGAMKRAAVQWGLGRELYSYPRVYIVGEHKYIPWQVLKRLEGLPAALAQGKRLPEVITLNPDGTDIKGGA